MQRVAVLSLAVLFGLSAVAKADPVVTLGTYNVSPGVASFPIQIKGYYDSSTGTGGAGGVQGFDLNISIHDVSGNANLTGPKFTLGLPAQGLLTNSAFVGGIGVNGGIGGDVLTGTIFGAAPHTNPGDGGGSSLQNLQIGVGITSGLAAISSSSGAQSLLATVYINTVGVLPGTTWHLVIGGTNLDPDSFGPDNGPLDFGDGGAFATTLVDGIIQIVPEPSSVVLGLFAAAGLALAVIRRKRNA